MGTIRMKTVMVNDFEDIGIEQYVFKYCFMRSCGCVSYQPRFRLGIILATVLTRDLNQTNQLINNSCQNFSEYSKTKLISKRRKEPQEKYLFKRLRSIVLLNATEKVCLEKACLQYIGFGFVLHSTHTEKVQVLENMKIRRGGNLF